VCLADGDNELPIDLDNVLSVETFVELTKGRDQAVLVEFFPGPGELFARGPEGCFVHEVVIPFTRIPSDGAGASGPATSADHAAPSQPGNVRSAGRPGPETGGPPQGETPRSFPPGSVREGVAGARLAGPAGEGGAEALPAVLKTRLARGPDAGPFAVDELALPGRNPWGARLRLTGLDFLPGGALAVCTWDGDVWLVGGLGAPPAS
jgi:hypothetical protein